MKKPNERGCTLYTLTALLVYVSSIALFGIKTIGRLYQTIDNTYHIAPTIDIHRIVFVFSSTDVNLQFIRFILSIPFIVVTIVNALHVYCSIIYLIR